MLFNTIQFALFFAFVLISYKVAPPKRRNSILLASSLIFYTLWIPSYLILLLVDLWVNYALMRAMVVSERPKIFLAASINALRATTAGSNRDRNAGQSATSASSRMSVNS